MPAAVHSICYSLWALVRVSHDQDNCDVSLRFSRVARQRQIPSRMSGTQTTSPNKTEIQFINQHYKDQLINYRHAQENRCTSQEVQTMHAQNIKGNTSQPENTSCKHTANHHTHSKYVSINKHNFVTIMKRVSCEILDSISDNEKGEILEAPVHPVWLFVHNLIII